MFSACARLSLSAQMESHEFQKYAAVAGNPAKFKASDRMNKLPSKIESLFVSSAFLT
jgi:hypothetical protein